MVTEKYWAQINNCYERFIGRWHQVIPEMARFQKCFFPPIKNITKYLCYTFNLLLFVILMLVVNSDEDHFMCTGFSLSNC